MTMLAKANSNLTDVPTEQLTRQAMVCSEEWVKTRSPWAAVESWLVSQPSASEDMNTAAVESELLGAATSKDYMRLRPGVCNSRL
jgi:hypothetical protein